MNMIAVKHLSILDDPRIKLCHDVSPKPLTHKKGYPLNQWSSAIACAALDYLSKFARKIENYAGLDPTQTRNTMSSHLYRINGAKINAFVPGFQPQRGLNRRNPGTTAIERTLLSRSDIAAISNIPT
ncbi:hypothetical protein [Paenibacillus sp. BK033]|uniref:hypothetical protein n=1 Tax=Paenibacillus sp. BK033 TaxID=2512133 RepID=UPI0010439DC1|nr:hypothetical protein [Paenibacillus sp. BK033]